MKQIPFLVFISILLASCGGEKTSEPRSSGKTAEMIVATNNETKWEGKVGETVRAFFDQDYEVLQQPEPLFEMASTQITKLNNTKMFKSHHNILIIDIDENTQESKLEARKDFWASPQRVISITAPSEEEFVRFFNEKKDVIYSILMDSEYERLIKTFKAFRDRDIVDKLSDNFKFTLEIPSGFYIAKQIADFAWIRKETQNNSQGLLVYSYNFVDTMAFDQARIIAFRNSMTEEYIPGPTEGSFMVVDEEYSPVISKKVDFNGMFAVETRGLWKVEGDFMGGAFVNYTFVDERRNKVVTIDGYVYAPNKPKRDLLIQMEAIAHSLQFVD
ncbi:MAG: DUF4837 family protein [Bacteroidales bacterium]